MVIPKQQQSFGEKPNKSQKSASKKGKPPTTAKVKLSGKALGKKPPPIPRRFPLLGIVGLLIAVVAVITFCLAGKETPPPGEQQKKAFTPPYGSLLDPPTAPSPSKPALPKEVESRPVIRAIRLTPSQPTRLDTLKATVIMEDQGQELTYAYRWKVNDKIVEDAEKDTLPLANLRKRDLVTVTITPYDGDKAGFPVESPVIALYGIPPTLDLQASRELKKTGGAVALQLISKHPDSDTVTFGLGTPLVTGMSIDARTGKITWLIQPGQKGTIRFGASVEDADGTKVTKTFEVVVD